GRVLSPALAPACQPSQATAIVSTTSTTRLRTRERPESRARVPLESPAKTRPTTGSTGAPHPTTLHGPVERPGPPPPPPAARPGGEAQPARESAHEAAAGAARA